MDPASHLVLAAAGGALGATIRWSTGVIAERWRMPNWIVIMVVNTVGCLAMGFALGCVVNDRVHAFLLAGVLGGFTTFSTAMLDAWLLWRFGRRLDAGVCLIGTPVLAVIAVIGGVSATAVFGGVA
jgi:CrcB protein